MNKSSQYNYSPTKAQQKAFKMALKRLMKSAIISGVEFHAHWSHQVYADVPPPELIGGSFTFTLSTDDPELVRKIGRIVEAQDDDAG